MAEGVADNVCQYSIPNERLIYDLITKNNLPEIRAQLGPLTRHHRQLIVCKKVENKTLLVHACGHGFRDLVKYLLDECEADISEVCTHGCKTLSPLRLAMANQDILMLTLLLRRGVVAANKSEANSCVNNASIKNYLSTASIVWNYTDAASPLRSFPDYPRLFIGSNYAYINNDDQFLKACEYGDMSEIKDLLANGIYTKVTNDSSENALCIAILKRKSDISHFLLNYRVFTAKDYIRALEWCGAKFIFSAGFENGIQCWKKSIRIRTEYSFGVSDKFDNVYRTDLGLEFSREEQVDLFANDGHVRIQALLVFLRLLSPSNKAVHIAFAMVARDPAFNDLIRPLKILGTLADFPDFPNNDWIPPLHSALITMETLFRIHFRGDTSNKDDILMGLRQLLEFIKIVNWKVLLRRRRPFHRACYINLLRRVLNNLIYLTRFKLTTEDKAWMRDPISDVLKLHPDPYPTTLLHLSIEESAPYPIIAFLVWLSNDVNCTDSVKNTPMHATSLLQADKGYILRLVNLLVDAGGHIDAVNKFGFTPFTSLSIKGVIKNPLKYISLKCLAAKAVGDNNISVPEDYPKILSPFVEIHRK